MKKNFKNMAAICLTVGSLTLGTSFSVFAADTSTSSVTPKTKTTQSKNYNKKHNEYKAGGLNTAALVKDGVIDQTTADAITAYVTELQTEKKVELDKVKSMTADEKKAYFESLTSETKTSLLDQLVSKGIITADQETAIKAAQSASKSSKTKAAKTTTNTAKTTKTTTVKTNTTKTATKKASKSTGNKSKSKSFNGKSFKNRSWGGMNKLDTATLVKDGVIDQTTADAITAYVTKLETDKKAEMDKVKAMTADQKKAYFESQKSTAKTSLLDELVSDNVITSDQKTAIETKLATLKSTNTKGNFGISNLVSKGIIDQTTADAITAYMTELQTERKAEMDKVKAMTADEKKAYFESKKSETKTNILDELVSKGIITQDQETAIKAAMPSHKKAATKTDSTTTTTAASSSNADSSTTSSASTDTSNQ